MVPTVLKEQEHIEEEIRERQEKGRRRHAAELPPSEEPPLTYY
jgi:hypothetical protein